MMNWEIHIRIIFYSTGFQEDTGNLCNSCGENICSCRQVCTTCTVLKDNHIALLLAIWFLSNQQDKTIFKDWKLFTNPVL